MSLYTEGYAASFRRKKPSTLGKQYGMPVSYPEEEETIATELDHRASVKEVHVHAYIIYTFYIHYKIHVYTCTCTWVTCPSNCMCNTLLAHQGVTTPQIEDISWRNTTCITEHTHTRAHTHRCTHTHTVYMYMCIYIVRS